MTDKQYFNDTFMMILIRIKLVSHKNEWFFFIKCMFCFSFLHHLENYDTWIVLYCMPSVPKGQKEKSEQFGYILFLKMK